MASFRKIPPPVPVAHAEKFTEVKEGQQHPVGRGGQLKLFHEHVWPKGYNPKRIEAINNMYFDVNGSPNLHPEYVRDMSNPASDIRTSMLLHDKIIPASDKIAKSLVTEGLARSTAPISDLKKLHRPNGQLQVSVSKGDGNPSYVPINHEVKLTIPDEEPSHIAMSQTGPTSTNIQTTLLHEVGHALDANQNPLKFHSERVKAQKDPAGHTYNATTTNPMGSLVLPRAEGVAEGYRLAHTRVTRGQKRRDQDAAGGEFGRLMRVLGSDAGTLPGYGYKPELFNDPEAQNTFVQTRNDTFKKATGHHFENMENEPAPAKKQPEQPTLFD
jgi:hypothetical protein